MDQHLNLCKTGPFSYWHLDARARTRAEAHGDGRAAARVDGVNVHHCGRRQRPGRVAGDVGRAGGGRVGAQARVDGGQVELRAVDAAGLRSRRGQAPALLRLPQQLPHALDFGFRFTFRFKFRFKLWFRLNLISSELLQSHAQEAPAPPA